jgi:hypothetical protein
MDHWKHGSHSLEISELDIERSLSRALKLIIRIFLSNLMSNNKSSILPEFLLFRRYGRKEASLGFMDLFIESRTGYSINWG